MRSEPPCFDSTRLVNTAVFHFEAPVPAPWDPVAFVLTGVALTLIFWRGWSPLRTLGLSAALGLVATLLT